LAFAYFLASDWTLPPRESLNRARSAAKKALEVDESLAEAHPSLAIVLFHDWDWPAAEREFRRALICGFPEETWEDIRETTRVYMHSARCPHSDPQLNLLAPLAATPIYWKYRDKLLLEELCSDMSHQARIQKAADLDLIRAYPEIFANFYAIPTPHLDRAMLRELWEFTLMGLARCRWLLVAIEQNTSGILDFFMRWRKHRIRIRPILNATELRLYYRTNSFRMEFSSFVRSQKVGQVNSVKALLDYQDALTWNARTNVVSMPAGDLLSAGTSLQGNDVPVRRKRIVVFELGLDLQRVIDGLKAEAEPLLLTGRHFYVTRPVSPASLRIDHVSECMAVGLSLCDGRNNLHDVIRQLSERISDVEKSLGRQFGWRLVEACNVAGFIDIYRPYSSYSKSASTLAS
jgi:hypothetical protein